MLLQTQESIAAANSACIPAPARQPPAQKEELENEAELQKEILSSWSRLDTLKLIELYKEHEHLLCSVKYKKKAV